MKEFYSELLHIPVTWWQPRVLILEHLLDDTVFIANSWGKVATAMDLSQVTIQNLTGPKGRTSKWQKADFSVAGLGQDECLQTLLKETCWFSKDCATVGTASKGKFKELDNLWRKLNKDRE